MYLLLKYIFIIILHKQVSNHIILGWTKQGNTGKGRAKSFFLFQMRGKV